jgi:lipoprotein-anchoring transpeptidase ErfK/SrfK
MSDLFLDPPSRPRYGCLLAGLAALAVVGAGVWYFFFREGKPDEPKPPASGLAEAATSPPPVTPAAATPRAGGNSRAPNPVPPKGPFNPATDRGAALLIEAAQFKDQDKLLEAREKAHEVLTASQNPEALKGAEALLGALNIRILLNPIPAPEKVEYIVKSGDVLSKIAQRMKTTAELIARGNGIQNNMIRLRQRLLITQGTFRIVVDKSDNDLLVLFNDRFFKRYRVGTGQFNKTPVGTFKVNDKIVDPVWWRPDGKAIPFGDPENLLGTRWISLNIRSYGIHGTWEPESIGSQSSAGCIRMLNEEVEELFIYIPLDTQVEIKD